MTKDGMHPLSKGNGGKFPAQENEIHPRSPVHEESQPASEVHPQSLVFEHTFKNIFGIPRPKGTVGATLHMFKVPHPLEKGGVTVSYTHLTLPTKRIV